MAKAKLETYASKRFLKILQQLRAKDGIALAAYREVVTAMNFWSAGDDADLNATHHGESRVPHAAKYDLRGFYRLVTWEHDGLRELLFVGTHDDVDHWLNTNRGRDFAYDKETGDVSYGSIGRPVEEIYDSQRNVRPVLDKRGSMFDAIPAADWARLELSPETERAIRTLATYERCDEEESFNVLQALHYPSAEVKSAILNAFLNLAHNEPKAALHCVRRVPQKAATASEDSVGFRRTVLSGNASEDLLNTTQLTVEDLDQLLEPARFSAWMLYLAPEQRTLVSRQYSAPARLIGVSGSGKTCVLVHRAKYLANKYPGNRILILTLGRSLVRLIHHLLDQLCTATNREHIEVTSIYDYCYRMVKTIEPRRLIEQVDPRSGEDLERCWHDFIDKPHAKDNLDQIFWALQRREDPVRSPETYVLEELVWIRTGFGRAERDTYLTCERPGRGIPLPKWTHGSSTKSEYGKIPPDSRRRLLDVLTDYEEYMQCGGLLDRDGVSLEAFALREQLPERDELRARCVLVDEIQDISTNELAVLAQIPTDAQDGLFLCGDPVQKVFPKQHNLAAAGIDIRGRSTVLRRNYRNSRHILAAAFRIIDEFAASAAIPESEILRPEYAYREGQKPTLYECASREQQLECLMLWFDATHRDVFDATCVCSVRRETLEQVVEACTARGIATSWLTGGRHYADQGVKVAELEHVKGHEFASVYILDVSDRDLPAKGTPWEERWRDAFQIYVAMTRARDELSLMFVYNRSILLGNLQDTVMEEHASVVVE